MNDKSGQSKTRWHRLLGRLLEELLVPVGIEVYTDVALMSNSPEADILLLKRSDQRNWTKRQLEVLPDGVRDSKANHILIEFKYTESIGEEAITQTLGYDIFYRRSHRSIPKNKIATFLISAKKPGDRFLKTFSYKLSKIPGIYKSKNYLLRNIQILSLNELSDTTYNVFVKCFASRKREKRKALEIIRQQDLSSHQISLTWFISGLWKNWFGAKENDMEKELTPEKIIEMGKIWGDWYLSNLSPEERLRGLKAEERLRGLKAEERLRGLKAEERLRGLKAEERLKGLKAEERLKGLSIKEIEAYLKRLKKSKK